MRTLLRILGIVVTILLVAAASYFGYNKHQEYKFVQLLSLHVKDASNRVANDARHDYDESTLIRQDEFMARIDTDISEIDKRILEIQTSSIPATNEKMEAVVSYLWACQDLLRSIRSKYAKLAQLGKIGAWARERKQYFEERLDLAEERGSMHSTEYKELLRTTRETLDSLKEAQSEYELAVSEVSRSARELSDRRSKILPIVSSDALVDSTVLDRILQGSASKAQPNPCPQEIDR